MVSEIGIDKSHRLLSYLLQRSNNCSKNDYFIFSKWTILLDC